MNDVQLFDMVNISGISRTAEEANTARQRLSKARIATRAKEAVSRKKWAQVLNSAALGAFSFAIIHGMDTLGVPDDSMIFAIPAIGFVFSIFGLCRIVMQNAVVIE